MSEEIHSEHVASIRWVRGIYEAVVHMDQGLTREELVRICAHEALRLFSDRLVEDEEIQWCSDEIDEVARQLLLQLITMRFSNAQLVAYQ